MPQNTQDIAQVLLRAGDVLTKKDFVNSFRVITDFVLKIQQRQAQAIQDLTQKHNALVEELKGKHNKSLEDLKIQTNQLFVKDRLDQIEGGNKSFLSKINKIIDQKLKDVDFKVASIKPIKGDKGDPGQKGDPGPSPTEHIKIMEETKEELDRTRRILSNRSMGRVKVPSYRTVDLSAQCNGQTRTFTGLPKDTVKILLIQGSQFPFTMNSNDWTLNGTQFTLNNSVAPPEAGQTLMALCEVMFYSKG